MSKYHDYALLMCIIAIQRVCLVYVGSYQVTRIFLYSGLANMIVSVNILTRNLMCMFFGDGETNQLCVHP